MTDHVNRQRLASDPSYATDVMRNHPDLEERQRAAAYSPDHDYKIDHALSLANIRYPGFRESIHAMRLLDSVPLDHPRLHEVLGSSAPGDVKAAAVGRITDESTLQKIYDDHVEPYIRSTAIRMSGDPEFHKRVVNDPSAGELELHAAVGAMMYRNGLHPVQHDEHGNQIRGSLPFEDRMPYLAGIAKHHLFTPGRAGSLMRLGVIATHLHPDDHSPEGRSLYYPKFGRILADIYSIPHDPQIEDFTFPPPTYRAVPNQISRKVRQAIAARLNVPGHILQAVAASHPDHVPELMSNLNDLARDTYIGTIPPGIRQFAEKWDRSTPLPDIPAILDHPVAGPAFAAVARHEDTVDRAVRHRNPEVREAVLRNSYAPLWEDDIADRLRDPNPDVKERASQRVLSAME